MAFKGVGQIDRGRLSLVTSHNDYIISTTSASVTAHLCIQEKNSIKSLSGTSQSRESPFLADFLPLWQMVGNSGEQCAACSSTCLDCAVRVLSVNICGW